MTNKGLVRGYNILISCYFFFYGQLKVIIAN